MREISPAHTHSPADHDSFFVTRRQVHSLIPPLEQLFLQTPPRAATAGMPPADSVQEVFLRRMGRVSHSQQEEFESWSQTWLGWGEGGEG